MANENSTVHNLRETLAIVKEQNADLLGYLTQVIEGAISSGQVVTGIAFVLFSKETHTELNEETGEEEVVEEDLHSVPFFMLDDVDGPVSYALSHAGNLLSDMALNPDDYDGDE